MRVLVLGGSGFVGRNLLEHPSASSYEVLSPGRDKCDLDSLEEVEGYLNYATPDMVIHAAGLVGGIRANLNNDQEYYQGNLRIASNVLLASRLAGVARLINLASSCMYSPSAPLPFKEADVFEGDPEPTNKGYATAKRMSTSMAIDGRYKTLVPCNLYGRFDHFDPERSHVVGAVIAKIFQAVRFKATIVPIWGDGQAKRELLFAEDLADCVWRAVGHYDDLPEVMNVGSSDVLSIDEIYREVAEVLGYQGDFRHVDGPKGIEAKYMDSTLAQQWGWQAKTPFKEGIRLAVDYFRDQMAASRSHMG